MSGWMLRAETQRDDTENREHGAIDALNRQQDHVATTQARAKGERRRIGSWCGNRGAIGAADHSRCSGKVDRLGVGQVRMAMQRSIAGRGKHPNRGGVVLFRRHSLRTDEHVRLQCGR